MDSFTGILWMHTLRKLPKASPKNKENIVIMESRVISKPNSEHKIHH